jgi:hypothetical protein
MRTRMRTRTAVFVGAVNRQAQCFQCHSHSLFHGALCIDPGYSTGTANLSFGFRVQLSTAHTVRTIATNVNMRQFFKMCQFLGQMEDGDSC